MSGSRKTLHPLSAEETVLKYGARVGIDISDNWFYSRNTFPVSVSGLTHLGNARGGS
jgi:hypothetical protein